MRRTVTTTMSPPCSRPPRPGSRHAPGWSATGASCVATASATCVRAADRRAPAQRLSQARDQPGSVGRSCGIDPSGLAATVAEYNRHAREAATQSSAAAARHSTASRATRRIRGRILRRPHRTRTVLRGAGRARLLRYLRRAEDRRPGPRAGRRRPADPRPVRGGSGHGESVRRPLSLRRHQPGTGADLGYIAGRHIAGAIGYEQEQRSAVERSNGRSG